jgi:hypothetical protein
MTLFELIDLLFGLLLGILHRLTDLVSLAHFPARMEQLFEQQDGFHYRTVAMESKVSRVGMFDYSPPRVKSLFCRVRSSVARKVDVVLAF